jgi:hypothetical protein
MHDHQFMLVLTAAMAYEPEERSTQVAKSRHERKNA